MIAEFELDYVDPALMGPCDTDSDPVTDTDSVSDLSPGASSVSSDSDLEVDELDKMIMEGQSAKVVVGGVAGCKGSARRLTLVYLHPLPPPVRRRNRLRHVGLHQ